MSIQTQLRPGFIRANGEVNKESLTDAERTALAKRTPPENRRYVILVVADPGCEEDHRWIECFGRTEAYEQGKDLVMSGYVNILESVIMVEGGQGLENALSLSKFMKFMHWNYYRDDTSWDIHEYIFDVEEGSSDEDTSTQIGIDLTGNVNQGAMMFSSNNEGNNNV